MILLLVSSSDFTVQEILRWLDYYEKKYILLNEINYIDDLDLALNDDVKITLKNGTSFFFSEITSVFDRRGRFWFRENLPYGYVDFNNPNKSKREDYLNSSIKNYIKDELTTLDEYLIKKIKENRFYIGDYKDGNLNKLKALDIAKKVGLKIPKTVINTSPDKMDKKTEFITKAIKEGFNIQHKNVRYNLKTHLVDMEDIPKKYSPTLFQNKLNKKYELRIFYLKEQFYTMAIFSQNNPNTTIDFRNYNKPIRTSPYTLPKKIEQKIIKLMKGLSLSTGSIDIVYTKSNEYVFLEVNPTGQFGMVSSPCNYNIEKQIAKIL